jgi:hypothetical protein
MSEPIQPPSAVCHVLTYKEGLLSAVAHDLRIRIGRFTLNVDRAANQIVGSFDTVSLVVDTVMRGGQPVSGVLSSKDFDKIAGNIRDDVLASRAHPTATWRAPLPSAEQVASGRFTLRGDLTLKGVTRSLAVDVHREGDAWIARVRIHQPDFGIRPYSAMLGALKVKPEVDIELRAPVAATL